MCEQQKSRGLLVPVPACGAPEVRRPAENGEAARDPELETRVESADASGWGAGGRDCGFSRESHHRAAGQTDTAGAVACGAGRTHSRHRGCGCLGGPCALPAAPQTDCTMPTPDTQMLPRRGAGGHRSHRRKPSRPWIRRRSPGRDTGSAREPKERQRLHAAHLAARVVTFSRGAKLYPRMPDFL